MKYLRLLLRTTTAAATATISVILSFYLLAFVESYSPNPRAIHPNGKLPSKIQAKRRLPTIQDEIIRMKKDDSNLLIMIDGNNIRNSFGYQHMSALGLTEKLSTWFTTTTTTATVDNNSDDDDDDDDGTPPPQIVCFWDGGKTRTSQIVDFSSSSTTTTIIPTPLLTAYSGPDGNADDLLVQCCSFVSSIHNNKCNNKVVIFTSDANLANRCQLQCMGKDKDPSNMDVTIYHSIYLYLLLSYDDDTYNVSHGSDIFAPDWERDERRRSVSELESFLEQQQQHKNDKSDDSMLPKISEWINGGLEGINVGRVTRGGSVLYTYNANTL